MADEEKKEEVQEDEGSGKKSSGKGLKGLIASPIILVAIVLVAQAGIALMMVNMIGGGGNEELNLEGKQFEQREQGTDESSDAKRGKIISLENMVVNLKENNKLYYLKLTVGLEIENSDMEEEIKLREPNLRDIIIEHVSSRKVSDLDSREERTALKKDLHLKINDALRTGNLIKLYFSQFVIQ